MYHQPHPNQQQQHQPPLLLGDDTPQRQLETALKAECSGQDKSKAATALMFDAFTSFAAANFASCPPSTSSSFFIPPNPTPIVAPLPCSSSSTAIGPPPIGGGTAKRERTKYTEGQLRYLEGVFRNTMYPEGPLREQIAKCLQLSEVKVQVWFKNRRAKNRNERKFEQMRGEAVGGGKGQAVKKEESVEDTEEENQQQEPQHPAAKKHALDRAKKRRSNSNKSASPPATQTAPAVELSQSSSLFLPYDLKGFSQGDASPLYQPPTFYPSSFGSSSAAPAEMNSLMAAAFPTPVQSFYTGWTQSPTSYAPILSSPYQNQMFGPAAAAAYYQTNNYYFAAQQAAAQQQQEGMKREEI